MTQQVGSFYFIAELIVDLDLEYDTPVTDHCGTCTACIDACPTEAIVEPYVVNAETCISYITIEFRGQEEEIPEELKQKIGNRIFGCDDCLDICPYNNHRMATDELAFQPSEVTIGPNLFELATLGKKEFTDMFTGSPIRRAKHEGFLRNLQIAQRNAHLPQKPNVTRPS